MDSVQIIRPVPDRMELLKTVTIQGGGHRNEASKEDFPDGMPETPNMCVMEALSWIMNDSEYSTTNAWWVNDSPVCVYSELTEAMIGINDNFSEVNVQIQENPDLDAISDVLGFDSWIDGHAILDNARTRMLAPLIPLLIGTAFTVEINKQTVQLGSQWLTHQDRVNMDAIKNFSTGFYEEIEYELMQKTFASMDEANAEYNRVVDRKAAELLELVTVFTTERKASMELTYNDPDHPIFEKGTKIVRFLPDPEAKQEATQQFISELIKEAVSVEELAPEYV